MAIINQAFGKNWAFYNGDCVLGMRDILDESIHFSVFSPPFLSLYIYSDSIADLGNTDSESQFFDGWEFHLKELHRVLKSGGRVAIHCKDTMRYMSSHDYAGLYDFPGQIVRLCEDIGFNLERWVTVWKDPVIEMQRTKTYGLLHKSFSTRAEVTRQGCPDYVLVFNKGLEKTNGELPPTNNGVIERMVHQWTNPGEFINTPLNKTIRDRPHNNDKFEYSFFANDDYTDDFIVGLQKQTSPGRLTSVHCTARMMVDIVDKFESVSEFKFHSRLSLTDGSFVVTFRNWSGEFENNVVKHNIKPPQVDYQKFTKVRKVTVEVNGKTKTDTEEKEIWKEPIVTGSEIHPDYVGTQPPMNWRDEGYYSILLWQKYASPVWFDLEGLPDTHPNCLMNIKQTNVLNYRHAKGEEEEKHICPLQLDLISLMVQEYTNKGEVVLTPYGGIGSEGYEAVKLRRKAILFELKENYWAIGCKNMITAENEITQQTLFDMETAE